MTMREEGHLGGYVEGGDPATIYPDMWRWLVEGPCAVRSVLDVGCGDGVAVRAFRELGVAVVGIDGVAQADPAIVQHDFTVGPPATGLAAPPSSPLRKQDEFDLVWSCEFVEHVDEPYIPNFLAAFQLGRLVLMTHADPGQPGYHHVNCRPADYWMGAMAASGFLFDSELTDVSRSWASHNHDPWNHFLRSGLAFRRS